MPAEQVLGVFEIVEAAREAGLEVVGPGQGLAGLEKGQLALVEWAELLPPAPTSTWWERLIGATRQQPARRALRVMTFKASDGLKVVWWPTVRMNELDIQPYIRGWMSFSFESKDLAELFGVEAIVVPTPEPVVSLPSDPWTEYDYDFGYGLMQIPLQTFKSEVAGIVGPFIEHLQAFME